MVSRMWRERRAALRRRDGERCREDKFGGGGPCPSLLWPGSCSSHLTIAQSTDSVTEMEVWGSVILKFDGMCLLATCAKFALTSSFSLQEFSDFVHRYEFYWICLVLCKVYPKYCMIEVSFNWDELSRAVMTCGAECNSRRRRRRFRFGSSFEDAADRSRLCTHLQCQPESELEKWKVESSGPEME